MANKFFAKEELDAYAAAGILARALPLTVAPLLTVLFTSRSGRRAGGIVAEQLKLFGLSRPRPGFWRNLSFCAAGVLPENSR